MKLEGLLAALLATYDDHGKISLERQAALIDHVLAQGLHGIFVSGSTGEAYLQTADERKELISGCISHVSGRGIVIAHTGAFDTQSTLSLTEYAAAAGANAVSAITPIYYKYDEAQHERYYRDVSSAAGPVPVIAYHYPARTQVNLQPDFFVRMAHEGILQGVKYTATDLYPLAEIARRTPPEFLVYCGSDEVLLGGLSLGAVGGIGSTYNAIGSIYARIRESLALGDLTAARQAQDIANTFIREMNSTNFLVFLREVLAHDGIPTGQGRSPLPVATAEQRQAVWQFLDNANEIYQEKN